MTRSVLTVREEHYLKTYCHYKYTVLPQRKSACWEAFISPHRNFAEVRELFDQYLESTVDTYEKELN